MDEGKREGEQQQLRLSEGSVSSTGESDAVVDAEKVFNVASIDAAISTLLLC